jgi:tRNA pseudouridine55 synthase
MLIKKKKTEKNQKMNDNQGILLVNKSKNFSSFTLVKILRKITKIRKIGHAGTLDPFATGLMIMLLGKEYTKKSSFYINHDKEYLCKLHLGFTTKSFDSEEELTFFSDKIPTAEELQRVLEKFQGTVEQIPPMYSAKKVNGQRLYSLARQDITIDRKPIQVTINTELLSYVYPYVELKISCSKGTYIRAIANDIGYLLGTGAYLIELKRTKSGIFNLKDAIDQSCLTEEVNLQSYLIR